MLFRSVPCSSCACATRNCKKRKKRILYRIILFFCKNMFFLIKWKIIFGFVANWVQIIIVNSVGAGRDLSASRMAIAMANRDGKPHHGQVARPVPTEFVLYVRCTMYFYKHKNAPILSYRGVFYFTIYLNNTIV